MSKTARRLLLMGSRRFSPLSLRPQVWLDKVDAGGSLVQANFVQVTIPDAATV